MTAKRNWPRSTRVFLRTTWSDKAIYPLIPDPCRLISDPCRLSRAGLPNPHVLLPQAPRPAIMCYTIFILEHELLLQSQSHVTPQTLLSEIFRHLYSSLHLCISGRPFLPLVFVPAVPGTLCILGSGWLTLSRNILASWHLHHQFHFPPSAAVHSPCSSAPIPAPRPSSIFFLWLYIDIS